MTDYERNYEHNYKFVPYKTEAQRIRERNRKEKREVLFMFFIIFLMIGGADFISETLASYLSLLF